MKQKILMIVLTLAIFGCLVSGSTGAYFTSNAQTEEATFTAGTVDIELSGVPTIADVPRQATKKTVSWTIENLGNNKVYLRARALYDPTANISIVSGSSHWTEGADGYFYYSTKLEPRSEAVFTLVVQFDGWEPVEGLPLDIDVEAIQATNDAKNLVWLAV